MTSATYSPIAHTADIWINGVWQRPHSGRVLSLVSPDTEQVFATVAEGDEVDMDAAVAAARAAFDSGPWGKMLPAERMRYLRRMADYLKGREAELAQCWNQQVGVLAGFAAMATGGNHHVLDQLLTMGEQFEFAQRRPTMAGAAAIVAYEPVGVVAAIAPWNGPYGIMLFKVVNALIAGCTVIMKPSPETPLEAYIIAQAAEAADLPAGVLNLVTGQRDASDHLVCNPGVDKVSFTGSTVAGKRIASVCGSRIARYMLELGGKSAAIICDDFPIDAAAKLLANTITMMNGQVCAMLSRAIVPRHRHDALAAAIGAEMEQIKVGLSTDPASQLGPLAMERQWERVNMFVDSGKQSADLVTGGKRPAGLTQGYFIEPTLFANVPNDSRIAQEEIFGPVLSLIPCDDEADAIRIANDSVYGLSGSVLTLDHDRAYRIARQVRTGGVGQNGLRMDFALPYGGFKQSGVGREGGVEGLMAYLESKTIILDGMPSQL